MQSIHISNKFPFSRLSSTRHIASKFQHFERIFFFPFTISRNRCFKTHHPYMKYPGICSPGLLFSDRFRRRCPVNVRKEFAFNYIIGNTIGKFGVVAVKLLKVSAVGKSLCSLILPPFVCAFSSFGTAFAL